MPTRIRYVDDEIAHVLVPRGDYRHGVRAGREGSEAYARGDGLRNHLVCERRHPGALDRGVALRPRPAGGALRRTPRSVRPRALSGRRPGARLQRNWRSRSRVGTDTPRVGLRDISRRQLLWTRAERGLYERGHLDWYAADPGCLRGAPHSRHASTNRRRAGGADGFLARR